MISQQQLSRRCHSLTSRHASAKLDLVPYTPGQFLPSVQSCNLIQAPTSGILAPTMQVAERFQAALGNHASTYLISVDSTENNREIISSVLGLLERFALDVIVAAPACGKLLATINIPSTWQDTMRKNNGTVPSRESVFIEAKPVDAIDAILKDSWIGKLRPGWLLSASFV